MIVRSADRADRRIPFYEAIQAMIDAAEVHAKASALFEYGRESSDMDAKSTRKEINSAFFQAGIVTADQEGDLAKVLDGRYPE